MLEKVERLRGRLRRPDYGLKKASRLMTREPRLLLWETDTLTAIGQRRVLPLHYWFGSRRCCSDGENYVESLVKSSATEQAPGNRGESSLPMLIGWHECVYWLARLSCTSLHLIDRLSSSVSISHIGI